MVDAIWLAGCCGCGLRQGPWLGGGGSWAFRRSDPSIAARCHMTQLMLGPGQDHSAIRFMKPALFSRKLISPVVAFWAIEE